MISKNNNQLREKNQMFEFSATSAGITRTAENVSFHALLEVERGVIKL
jgi:hypothetical protein